MKDSPDDDDGWWIRIPPATRYALMISGFFLGMLLLSGYWVGREAARVRRERRQTVVQNRPGVGEMRLIPAGKFTMGGVGEYAAPDELPLHDVKLSAFYLDIAPVTNEQFARFTEQAHYVTTAERGHRGGLCFHRGTGTDAGWVLTPGADWRHPDGESSSLEGREKQPVVLVSYDDALAFARWAGKRLPTEAEWEYSARGGIDAQVYAWGNEKMPDGQWRANVWQGRFPAEDTGDDGFRGTSPVGSFPPNNFGLLDMTGNVWEWTNDWYRADWYALFAKSPSRAARLDPHGPDESMDPQEPGVPKKAIRGGSYLSGDENGRSYRVSAREKAAANTARQDLGFRCAKDAPKP